MRPISSRRTNNKIQQGHSQFDGHLQQLATTSCNNSRKLQMQLIKEKNNIDDKLQIFPATKQMRPTAHSAQRATCNLQRGTGNVQQQQQQRESASQTGRHRQRRSRALLQHVKINQLIDLVLFMSNSISINEQRTRMQNAKAATMRASETERWREREGRTSKSWQGSAWRLQLALGLGQVWFVAFFCWVFCLGVALRRACVKWF